MRSGRVVVIAGAPRSGTTILQKAFCTHPEVAFLSRLHGRLGALWPLAILPRVFRRPRLAAPLYTFDSWISPSETYGIFGRIHPDFPVRNLRAADLDPAQADRWERLRRRVTRLQRRPVLCLKYTGWDRMAYMQAAFRDLRAIWISRDPVAVGASTHRFGWWQAVARHNSVDPEDPEQALPFHAALAERLDADGLASVERLEIPHVHLHHAAFVDAPLEQLAAAARIAGLDPDRFERRYLDRLNIGPERARKHTSALSDRDRELLTSGLGTGAELDLTPWT